MRTNLLRTALVFALMAFAALGMAGHFFASPWTPALVSLLFMAIWIPALRWWYRNELPQVLSPRQLLRRVLVGLALILVIGGAGAGTAALLLPNTAAQLLSYCDLRSHNSPSRDVDQ